MIMPLLRRIGHWGRARLDAMVGPAKRDAVLHGIGFVVSGACAFTTDALVLEGLVRLGGLPPIAARIGAICCAMVVAWLAHRTWTFRLAVRPSLREFFAYAAVAWTTAAINYSAFTAILLVRPVTAPFVALVAASLFAMTFSYLGMRFGAFRKGIKLTRERGSGLP